MLRRTFRGGLRTVWRIGGSVRPAGSIGSWLAAERAEQAREPNSYSASDCAKFGEYAATDRFLWEKGTEADEAESRRNGPPVASVERQFTPGEEKGVLEAIEFPVMFQRLKQECAR